MSHIVKEETVTSPITDSSNIAKVHITNLELETNDKDDTMEHNNASPSSEKEPAPTEELNTTDPKITKSSPMKSTIKDEVSEATEDESMAVEALWQLGGGGYSEKEKSQIDAKGNTESPEQEPVRYPVIKSTFALNQCEHCSLSFPSEAEAQLHQSTCEARIKKVFTCTICSAYFDSKANYDNHMVCHEVGRPFSCRSCGSLFRQKSELQNHMCHQMLRNLQCNICGMAFSRASSLTNHMKVHSYIPGRALVEFPPMPSDSLLMEPGFSNNWSHENQTLPLLLPQLDMQSGSYYNQSSSDLNSWNMNLGLPDSLTSEDLPDSMDIAQEMTVNTSYLNVLNGQPSTFRTEFDELNGSEDSLEYDSQTQEDDKILCAQIPPNDDAVGPVHVPVKVEILHYPIANLKDTPSMSPTDTQADSLSKKKPHSCRFCGVSFTRAKALISHERLHQDYLSEFLECSKCGDVFLDSIRQKNHMCSANNASKIKPRLTKPSLPAKISTITSANEINKHNINIEEASEDMYFVDEDQEELASMAISSSKQKQNKHACRHCDKRFTTKQKMFRHMWIHRDKTFSCEICGETFSLQNELDSHRLSSHPSNSPHGCPICGKCFASRQGLWEHTRSHREGAAPHTCSLCGKGFSSRQGFLIHTRTHTGERPYGCRFANCGKSCNSTQCTCSIIDFRYCWKAFRDGGTLRKHERIHTGERPHVCPLCWRAFNQKVVLREHVRWVHAAPSTPPPFLCSLCSQMLPDKEDLCAHIVKHSDILAAQEKIKSNAETQPKLAVNKKDEPSQEVTESIATNKKIMLNIEVPPKSPDELKAFTCDMCSDMFSSRQQLLSHVRIHI